MARHAQLQLSSCKALPAINMTKFYLGIDTGATKSHALIADENGRILGFGQSGPGNWEGIGWEGTRQVLTEIIDQACQQTGIQPTQLSGAGFGLAGYDWPEDRAPHEQIIRDIICDTPFTLVNDVFIGLPAGSDDGWGVVVGAGTSCNCYGRNLQGKIGRVMGSSYWGDEMAGSGELVHRAVQMVARAWAHRGQKTKLADAFIAEVGAKDTEDLLAGLMRKRYDLNASYAPLVFAVANNGDRVAQDIVQWAGFGLGDVANGVIRQLDIAESSFDVVLGGSFFKGSPLLISSMERMIHTIAPYAQLVRLDAPPVIGAVLLGMEHDNLDRAILRQSLIQQNKQLV